MGVGAIIASRVPVNSTRDAGRGCWLKLKDALLNEGYTHNQTLPTMFALRGNGKVVGVTSANVDDLIYGSLPEVEDKMKRILDAFAARVQNEDR